MCALPQGGPLGKPSIQLNLPAGFLMDEDGQSITDAKLAVADILTVILGFGLATADAMSNHSNFTLNNLIACLIATDILQVCGVVWPGPWL